MNLVRRRKPRSHTTLAAGTLPALPVQPGVSYIMPILNEAEYIEDAVTSVLAQEYAGEKELVIAYGPSADGTTEILERIAAGEPRVTLVDNPSGSISRGLNAAIAAARHPVIIRVDGHSQLTPDYTACGIDTLRNTGAANCGGLMKAVGRTPFQKAVARAYLSRLGLGGPSYHAGDAAGEAESAYLGIFRAEVFDAVGAYDPELNRGEDWELNLRIREAGGLVYFDPRLAVTYWPRDSLTKLIRQFRATGIWRAELIRRHGTKNSLRFFAPPILVLGIAASLVEAAAQLTGTTRRWPKFLRRFTSLVHVPSIAYLLTIVGAAASAPGCGKRERFWFAIVVPTMHISWGVGFLRGLLFGGAVERHTGR